ncbi:NUDIX domain-containing protein [Halorhabdus salina]|uniref:NUDIX domain-containing protein n=1 Tax=Halorhabdus salina TaxID=2750670 RepID=UPI0015EF9CB6|nr:NUDIX domain-containing protein [Halorhabdus salina]
MTAAPAYCPHCGTMLEERRREGRSRRFCPDCEWVVYRNPDPAAGVLVVREDPPSVLLVKRSSAPAAGRWSLPAGYLEWDEPAPDAGIRELHEETTLSVAPADASLLSTRLRPGAHGGYTLVVIYVASAEDVDGTPSAGSDAAAVRYFEPAELDAAALEPEYRPVFEDAIDTVTGDQGAGGSPS